jgi:two-component system, NarL family, sensor histidine kinase DesK
MRLRADRPPAVRESLAVDRDDDVMVAELVSPKLGRAVRSDDEAMSGIGNRSRIGRGLALTGMLVIFLIAPLADAWNRHVGAARIGFLVVLLAGFLALFANLVLTRDSTLAARPTPWRRMAVISALGLLLPVVAGPAWLIASGIVGACYAAYLPYRAAAAGVLSIAAYCGTYALLAGVDTGTVVVYAFEPLVIGGFAYASGRRVELIQQLRTTRRELARSAVAEERLRISRDLHDLLGHTLSVIAVKAELARRLLPADPERARREIGEVEAAARRALHDVRDAVTGYRAPSLAVELVSARRTLTAAGIRCLVDVPEDQRLPADADALLAWAAREATTNVVRHSAATRCDIRLAVAAHRVTLEVGNDGVGEPAGRSGNGLAGLAERVAELNGTLTAGPVAGGWQVRVEVPA